MNKSPASGAIEKALAEHGVGTPAAESRSAEGNSGTGETDETSRTEAAGAAEGAEATPEPASSGEKPVESDSEASRSSEEAPASPEDSVQSLVDAALKRSAGKYGRQMEKVMTSPDPDTAYQKMLDELASRMASKTKSKIPATLKDVDLNDPDAVQSFLDQRVESMIQKYVDPIAKKTELREIDMEFKKLQTDHPDYHKYGKAMSGLIGEYPNMPLEHAYRIASAEAQKVEGREEAYANMAKKKVANLEVSTVKPKTSDAPVKVKNIREAVLRAVEEAGSTFGE